MNQQNVENTNNFNENVKPSSHSEDNVNIYRWKLSTWKDLPFGCKFIFFTSILMSVASLLFGQFQGKLLFWGSKVIYDYQIQRLFLTYLLDGWDMLTVVNLVTKLFWLRIVFCNQERKLSTVHFVIDTFLQSLLLNLVLSIFSSILYNGLGIIPYTYVVQSVGFSPLAMIFVWTEVARFTNYKIDFWFLPFLIPLKWVPGILLKYRITQGLQYFWADLFGCILGYLQFMVFKKRFIRLPFGFYQKVESIIPGFIKNSENFIKVCSVQNNLKFQSFNGGNLQSQSRVSAIGGIQIDNKDSDKVNTQGYQQRWKEYGQNKEIQPNQTKTDDLRNEDNLHPTQQKLEYNGPNPRLNQHLTYQNHSAIRLNDLKYNSQFDDDEEIQSESQDQLPNTKFTE